MPVVIPQTEASQRPRPPAPADHWALFLDVDGCLLDFADRPDAVAVPAALRTCLEALSRRLDGALALVSGRSLATLDALFGPLRLPAAGLHGLERRSGDGRLVEAPPPAPLLAKVRLGAQRVAAEHPGALVEDKGAAMALHWRQAPEAAEALRHFAEAALPWLHGYRLQPGDHVVELRPASADKGDAITAFMADAPFAGRTPVFAGDDLTDEHGFQVVDAMGGHSILVGRRKGSKARYGLQDPADLRAWIGTGGA